MTTKWIFGLALTGLLLTGGVQRAHAVTTVGQAAMPGMSMTASANGGVLTNGRAVSIGAGVVVGYVLMLNPYGAALLGAAMGGMLVDWVYQSYPPAAPTGR